MIKYIPEYYPITWEEYKQSQKLENKPIDPVIEDQLKEMETDCKHYKDYINSAITAAHEKFIVKHLHKNLIYSRTWGK